MIHGLKTKLGFNLVFFLLLAILLTDFVVIRIIEKGLIHQRVAYGRQLIKQIGDDFFDSPSLHESKSVSNPHGPSATGHPFLIHGLFTTESGEVFKLGELPVDTSFDIARVNERTRSSGNVREFFSGQTWGVFWKQSKYFVISAPVLNAPRQGEATLLIQLEDIHQTLRHSQKLFLFYGLANLFLLSALALFRFSRIVVRPIHRFIRLTEQVRSTEQFPAYPEKRNHEFNQLSNAIHQMARRIEADKEQLQSSLHSLEAAHSELKNTQKEMIRAEKLASVGRLSAGVAHEIGNPIGIVLGYLGLLKRLPVFQTENKGQDYIGRAEYEISRINHIIRQLLDFSRTSPGEKSILSIHSLIQDVGGMIADQPLMRNIELSYHLSAVHDKVFADYQQLRQVLVNLLINAADSIELSGKPETGRIRLQTRQIGADDPAALCGSASIEVAVTDNGTGIAREDIENIFDPFYTTKEPGKGTGLGLSVSYMIMEQQNGTIEARSELNKGTTMSLFLPLAAAPGISNGENKEFTDESDPSQHSHS